MPTRHQVRIIGAENDLLFAADGQRYIDLFSAHGTTWLGHGNKDIATAIAGQLQRIWISGGLETPVFLEAKSMVEGFFPPSHGVGGLYSTGMEAAEFAIRLARVVTRKNGVVGFERSMHGKSLATAYLGWDNKDHVFLPCFHRLPFVQSCPEEEILRQLKEVLTSNPVSALFIEPLQGSGGGHMASKRFYEEVSSLCRAHDVLLVFDEILTGFYRTGPPFFFSEMGFVPDIILIGKSLGNGFPVSGVVVDRKYPIVGDMLPGSTYAGNPLASAAVRATLGQIRSMNLPGRVDLIEKTITGCLGPLAEIDIPVRGKGALWIVEVPATLDVEEIVWNIYSAGVCVGYTGHQIRILPAATITMTNLERACAVVSEEVMKAHHG